MPHHTIPVIEGVFNLTYVENSGAAFRVLTGRDVFLITISIIVIAAILYYMFTHSNIKPVLKIPLCLILAGASGNLIDRLIYRCIVDFLDIRAANLPVLNIADIAIITGTLLLEVHIVLESKRKRSRV
jgi:signal peptidase II